MGENEYNFTQVLYDYGQVARLYNIDTRPTTFFIDKDGIIQKIYPSSFPDQQTIDNILRTMQ